MDWQSLEAIYRQAEPGAVPQVYLRGKAIYCTESFLSGPKSAVTGAFWHGKEFHPCDGMLINQWLGVKAVRARVYLGSSWLDGKPSIIMDYRGVSRVVWKNVRDEIREVAPGVYLGVMYEEKSCCAHMRMFFALETPACQKCSCR